MKILVLVKAVPDPESYSQLKIDSETKRLIREGVPTIIDPASRNALEEALICKGSKGSVTVLAMAPEFCRDKIIECLAMGADRAFMLSDSAFGGADTYATSFVLSEGVKAIENMDGGENFDLILAGNESADGSTAHVPVQLAEWLDLPRITGVISLQIIEGKDESSGKVAGTAGEGIRVSRKYQGRTLTFKGSLPAVVAVSREINKPRLINAMGIIKARKKSLTVWTAKDLKTDPLRIGLPGSPTQPGELFSPDISRAGRPLTDEDATAGEAAAAILDIIRKAGG